MQLSYIVSQQPNEKGAISTQLTYKETEAQYISQVAQGQLANLESHDSDSCSQLSCHTASQEAGETPPELQQLPPSGGRGRKARICCCSLLVIYWPSDFSQRIPSPPPASWSKAVSTRCRELGFLGSRRQQTGFGER